MENDSKLEILAINTSPIKVDEVRFAIRKLKNITGEILKVTGEINVQKVDRHPEQCLRK